MKHATLFEPLLRDLIREQASKLASRFPEKSFYGFAIDSNISFGQLWFSANTRADLKEHCATVYGGGSPDPEHEEELEWQFGDWSYKCFNRGDEQFAERWDPIAAEIQSWAEELTDENRDDEWDEWREEFLRTICRALIAVEAEGGLAPIRRDADFRLCAADHDEAVEAGQIRMDRVRDAKTS